MNIFLFFLFFCGSEIQVGRHHMGNTNEKFFFSKTTNWFDLKHYEPGDERCRLMWASGLDTNIWYFLNQLSMWLFLLIHTLKDFKFRFTILHSFDFKSLNKKYFALLWDAWSHCCFFLCIVLALWWDNLHVTNCFTNIHIK